MKILALVTDAFGGRGGIALYNRDLLTALCENEVVTQVVVLPRRIDEPIGGLPAKINYVAEAARSSLRYLISALRCVLTGARFDAIVCGHINLIPLAFLLRSILGVPVILEIYGIDAWEPSKRRIVNCLAPRSDAVISISEVTKRRFRTWSGCLGDKIFVVPNAIHLDDYGMREKDSDLLRKYGLNGRLVLMSLGRMDAREGYKGFDEVLDVLATISRESPRVVYLIAGEGSDRARLEAKAAILGVADRVIFTGYVPEEKKADYLRLADVFVMPSRGEGFGFVFLEAMACGVPVVASKVDGSREAVLDGEMGSIVDPAKPDEIIEAIRSALCRERAVPPNLEAFRFEKFGVRIDAVLRHAVTRYRSGASGVTA